MQGVDRGENGLLDFSCVIRVLVEDRLEGEVEGVGGGGGRPAAGGYPSGGVGVVWGPQQKQRGSRQGIGFTVCFEGTVECVSSWNSGEVERKGGVQAPEGCLWGHHSFLWVRQPEPGVSGALERRPFLFNLHPKAPTAQHS